ncbi:hypothetical protein ACTFIU_002922 [Dictyostelium citrinum]
MKEINTEILFFKVWRNNYLKNIILTQCKIYKDNRHQYFSSGKLLRDYEFKNYVENVYIQQKGYNCIQDGDLPINGVLKKVTLKGGKFISSSIIPNGVLSIIFPEYPNSFAIDLKNLPPSVNSLENVSIEDFSDIPQSITSLQFNKINTLPKENSKLSHDNNNNNENLTFKKKLSDNLKILAFGYDWDNNNSILNYNDLPSNLLTLDLGSYNNIFQKNILPNSITDLVVCYHETIFREGVLPNSLKSLIVTSKGNNKNISVLFNKEYRFPNGLEILRLYLRGFEILQFQDYILPKSLKTLDIGSFQNIKYSKESLIHLHKLESLSLGDYCSNLNEFHLPNSGNVSGNGSGNSGGSLTYLDLGNKFNDIIDIGVLPKSIKILKLGRSFNKQLIKDSIPDDLEELYFGKSYNHQIPPNFFPKKLKIFNLPN